MNSSNNSTPIECQTIEQLLSDPIYIFATYIQIFTILVIFICAAILFKEYKNAKFKFHGNLSLLIFNAIIFNLVHSFCWIVGLLRYKYLFFIYSNACDLLTPVWLAFLLYSSIYFQVIANSTIHFAIMLERVRATLFVRNYEREGVKYGISGMAIVWFLSISFTFGIIWSSLADVEMFSKPLGIIILASKYNAQAIIYSHYFAMFLSAVTAIGDFWVVQMNKIIQNRNSHQQQKEYSLSRNFQLNENVHSMRLIFPLDLSYAILFGFYLIAGVYLRHLRYTRQSMSNLQYLSYYDIILTLPLLHSAITLIIYVLFIKNLAKKRMTVKVQPLDESGQIYFQQLREQWKYQFA